MEDQSERAKSPAGVLWKTVSDWEQGTGDGGSFRWSWKQTLLAGWRGRPGCTRMDGGASTVGSEGDVGASTVGSEGEVGASTVGCDGVGGASTVGSEVEGWRSPDTPPHTPTHGV